MKVCQLIIKCRAVIILCPSRGTRAKVHLPVNILRPGFLSELYHLINYEVYGSSVLEILIFNLRDFCIFLVNFVLSE